VRTAIEQRRFIVLNYLGVGTLTNEGAAQLLDLSLRQVQRRLASQAERPAQSCLPPLQ
jgi:hypothetical protein